MFFKQICSGIGVDARFWVKKLGLEKHPEGGYYKETYRASVEIDVPGLGKRSAGTAIYYLLERSQFSAFHRIKSDEIWHFYAGSPLVLHVIDLQGRLGRMALGRPGKNAVPQAVVKAGCWFSASSTGRYSLVGCTVAPGFDFADFELARRDEMVLRYPEHKKAIVKYTR
jgi:predicted cupin superfamily sugar epimerase